MVVGLRTTLTVMLTVVGAVSCASAESRTALPPISGSPCPSPPPALPESLRAACGHPGAQAVLTAVPITVPKAQCDLTGVVVLYGTIGVTVPSDGGVEGFSDGISSSSELGANVDPITGDVTFS
jgi:hypothetical protein